MSGVHDLAVGGRVPGLDPELVYYAVGPDGQRRALVVFRNLNFSVVAPGEIHCRESAMPLSHGVFRVATLYLRGRPVHDFTVGPGQEITIDTQAVYVGHMQIIDLTLLLARDEVTRLSDAGLWPGSNHDPKLLGSSPGYVPLPPEPSGKVRFIPPEPNHDLQWFPGKALFWGLIGTALILAIVSMTVSVTLR